jgi:hypothetical protein
MKTIFTVIISLTLLIPMGGVAFAHTSEADATGVLQEGDTLDLIGHMSEEMMGEEAHMRMEELMTKLITGDLSSEEQEEMIAIMQDAEMGSGAMMMMMQMMGPQTGGAVAFGTGGMMGTGGSMEFGGTLYFTYWITILLVWAVLILGIAALWKWLSKGR